MTIASLPVLVRLLRQAGHDVLVPADLGISGVDDPVHLRHAVRKKRVLVTHNYQDFECLHELILEAQGPHPGICVIRRDNDPNRDMKPHRLSAPSGT